jgi:hypothetical protein
MTAAAVLSVGDRVVWRGAWGSAPPLLARVEGLERTPHGSCSKYGTPVPSMPWAEVADCAVVSLDNGSWAYGYQLAPLPVEVAR